MTILFENVLYQSAASSATTKATPANRAKNLWLNVKDDFGAVGDGTTVETTVLQTALTAACNFTQFPGTPVGGCILYFPPGKYIVNGPLNFTPYSSAVTIMGAGKETTIISGSVTGFILQGGSQLLGSNYHNANVISGLTINNTNFAPGNGCIRLQYIDTCSVIRDCAIQGFIGIDVGSAAPPVGGSFGSSIENCAFTGMSPATADSSFSAFPSGNVGIYFGQGALINCRFQNYHIAIAASEQGGTILGCSVEVSDIALVLGLRADGAWPANCFTVSGFQTEKVSNSIRVDQATACTIQNCVLIDDGAPNTHAPFASATWNVAGANLVEITTSSPHNIVANFGGSVVDLFLEFNGYGSGSGWLLNGQRQTCTVTSATKFTYVLTTNPGAFNPGAGNFWSWIQVVGVQINGPCTDNTFISLISNGIYSIGGIDLNGGGAAQAVNCTFMNTEAGPGWVFPPAAQKASWKFIQCWDQSSGFSTSPVNMAMHFADLPGKAGVAMIKAYIGMEYDIVDGVTNPIGNFGQTQTGTGTTGFNCKVRYNGANWTIMGG